MDKFSISKTPHKPPKFLNLALTEHGLILPLKDFTMLSKKKGWNTEEEAVPSVVKIHNMVNEECWRRVMEFEEFHKSECPTPKLLKFRGRPGDFTPKSRFWSFFGYSLPFDRHDWVVDRCGREVEYVIDFYQGQPTSTRPIAIHLDVRPKLTPSGAMDRMRMYMRRNF
mmetsp:Transcript_22111/g.34347  ORF Transcript_22111/g.34347 Transcript_22111/m.34347 type:complete len:168 (-) Transcript_22111:44-547(-)